MAILSIGGLATGLDTNTLIAKLLAFEAQPLNDLQQEVSATNQKKAVVADLKSRISALDSFILGFQTESQIFPKKAASADESVVKASASGSATATSHVVKVAQLATSATVTSSGVASSTTIISTAVGTFEFQVDGVTTTVNLTGATTLEDLRDLINAEDAGVTASIVDTGVGATPFQLVLRGDATGADNNILVEDVDTIGIADGTTLTFTRPVSAVNSQVTIDGVAIERSTNEVSDVLEGLTLSLKSAAPTTDVGVTVSNDTPALKAKISELVNKLNDIFSFVNAKTAFNDATKTRGLLAGEPSAESTRRALQNIMLSLIEDVGSYQALSNIGFKTNRQGIIELDSAALDAALDANFESVGKLFLGDDVLAEIGISEKIAELTDDLTDIDERVSLFAAAERRLRDRVAYLNDRTDEQQRLLEKKEKALRAQFANLEVLVSSLNQTSGFLQKQQSS